MRTTFSVFIIVGLSMPIQFRFRFTKRWPSRLFSLVLIFSLCLNVCFVFFYISRSLNGDQDLSSSEECPCRYRYLRKNSKSVQSFMDRFNIWRKLESVIKERHWKRSTKILLIAHMRSGSTFTGDILQQSKNTFYIYEPFFTVDRLYKHYIPGIYLNKIPRLRFKFFKKNVVKDIFSCNLTNIDITTLNQHHMERSSTTADYYKCVLNSTTMQLQKKCLNPLIFKCLRSKFIMIKTIRMTMDMVEELLKEVPNLKVIYLLRDPRAIMMSRVHISSGVAQLMTYQLPATSKLCEQMTKDLDELYKLRKNFPGKTTILLYEKLTQSPVTVAEKLYNFLGLKMTQSIKSYVNNITRGSIEDTCSVCVRRKNSNKTANKWRENISLEAAQTLDRDCRDVYYRLGYVSVGSKSELLNSSFLTWREIYVPGMLTNTRTSIFKHFF